MTLGKPETLAGNDVIEDAVTDDDDDGFLLPVDAGESSPWERVTSSSSSTSGYFRNETGNDQDGGGKGARLNWAALLLFAIVIATIGGNVLVCLAVAYMRKLQNMFNYFLVSLALSDMLSAILVMPLSIMRAAIGMFTVMLFVVVQ